MTKFKILFVDDDELVLRVAMIHLKSDKIDLFFAETGEECLEILKKDVKFDLILLDFMLPDTDGITILKQIRSCKKHRKTPVIIQTGVIDISANLLTELSCRVMYKPYSKIDLLGEIEKLGLII